MKNSVAVSFDEKFIVVDGQHVYFENGIETLPEHKNLNAIYWNTESGTVEQKNGSIEDNMFDESKYDEYVAPYVEQWEREIERLQAVEAKRIQEAIDEEKGLSEDKDRIEARLRDERNTKLRESDHMMLPDYPIDKETRQAVIAYRQALRDLPEQEGWPENIQWPICPVEIVAN